MFENYRLSGVFGALVFLFAASVTAEDLALEPCVNGAVSPTGTHATAALEREANGYHTWSDYAPYYLFAVSATYLDPPFDNASEEADETSLAN